MTDDEKRGAAVYVGWTTFKNALDQLAQGIPNRIDRTCFPGQAGGVQSQLLAALKFLGLTDDEGKPSHSLHALAVGDEAARKEQLKKILQDRYVELFALDLTKTTPAQLSETMAASYNVSGETREKAIRFFLTAASYAGIAMSNLLLKAKPSTTNGSASRRRRPSRPRERILGSEEEAEYVEAIEKIPAGEFRSVALKSGGTLTLSASAKFMSLSSADRNFVFGLIDKLEEYEGEK